jgi:hypothetical protein
MTQLFTPNFQRYDANGAPYSGAKLYFYQSNTTTPITVYQDAAKATPHASPVEADTSGTFPEIFVDTDPYKVLLTTAAGVPLETIDAIPLPAGAAIVGADLTAIEALSGTGVAVRSASNTWVLRTITAGASIVITNGDGVSGAPTVAVDAATTTNIKANTADKVLLTDDAYSAANEVTLTDAATITVDNSTFINAVVTLGGNRTLGTMASPVVNRTGRIRVVQDATGSRTLAYHADYEFAGGSAPILSTAANAQDVLYYDVIASGRVLISAIKAIA